jgi:hypothetical protein
MYCNVILAEVAETTENSVKVEEIEIKNYI